MTPISAYRLSAHPARRQRGVVLMVALIVLVALTLAGLSMVRSSDTSTTIAGNLVFRQAATQALDAGVEAAVAGVNRTWAGSSNTIPNKYYAYAQAQDSMGLPAGVDFNQANTLVNPGGLTGYTARYVVERMCVPPTAGTITDSYQAEQGNLCYLEENVSDMDSAKLGGQAGLGQIRKVHFRITVRVDGPRNTQTHAQVVLAAPMN
jgi:type IV pilus assembly protein PilX